MGKACSTNGKTRITCRILVKTPEGKRAIGRRRRWADNTRMHHIEIGWSGVD
jgi:hypothetical protein